MEYAGNTGIFQAIIGGIFVSFSLFEGECDNLHVQYCTKKAQDQKYTSLIIYRGRMSYGCRIFFFLKITFLF